MPFLSSKALPFSARAAALLGALLTPLAAQAKTTFYADRPTFLANAPVVTTLGFDGLAPDTPNGATFYPVPPGLTLSSINFSIQPSFTGEDLLVTGKNTIYPGNSVLAVQNIHPTQEDLFITFSSPVTAIGLDFGESLGGNFSNNTPIAFTLSDGETFSRTGTGTDLNFVGLTTTTPITTLDIQASNSQVLQIDNFTFGPPAPAVPEASTTVSFGLLLALGIGGVVIAKKRKQSA